MFDRAILPPEIRTFLDQSFYGNNLERWLIAAVIFMVTIAGLWIFKHFVISQIKALTEKSQTKLDDVLAEAINTINLPFYLVLGLFLASRYLQLEPFWATLISQATLVTITIYTTLAIQKIIVHSVSSIWKYKQDDLGLGEGFESFLKTSTGIILWTLAFIILLQNLGFNLTTLIGGLGIAGIAIAFALQNILSDMFAYVTIYLDRPFKVGDFIIFEDEMGTVTEIGKRTTRIKTLQGQELIVTNKHLTNAKINNYGRMPNRRVVFKIGVVYETNRDVLKKIPDIIRKIIRETDNCTLDRVHFATFSDSSLDFEVVYYVETGDYNDYMDVQQNLNYSILEAFDQAKISFAYPTQVIYNGTLK